MGYSQRIAFLNLEVWLHLVSRPGKVCSHSFPAQVFRTFQPNLKTILHRHIFGSINFYLFNRFLPDSCQRKTVTQAEHSPQNNLQNY